MQVNGKHCENLTRDLVNCKLILSQYEDNATQKPKISFAEIKVQNEGVGPAAFYIVKAYLGNSTFTLGGHHLWGKNLENE